MAKTPCEMEEISVDISSLVTVGTGITVAYAKRCGGIVIISLELPSGYASGGTVFSVDNTIKPAGKVYAPLLRNGTNTDGAVLLLDPSNYNRCIYYGGTTSNNLFSTVIYSM